ncbi:B-cadherin-like [Chelmon rostratus]|uniref:B-cadherin-like n=1 Tax=Chelmon rostratus TaxID=109905 RepID=UPI001BE85CA0|nr:B-cadherin-like [Chelmon rostratus]
MGTARFAVVWVAFIVVFQASALATTEEPTCTPGFQTDVSIFKVARTHLNRGMRLGKVDFTDCTDRTRFLFTSDDSHFMVQSDGTMTVKRAVFLHDGHRDFSIHSFDLQGRKMTLPVRVLYHGHHHGNHHQNVENHHGDHHNQQHHLAEVDSDKGREVPVLHFPKSGEGLSRRKRDWVIPDINVAENDRGPYPLKVSQIRSNEDKIKKIYYSITGPGADEDPVNLFTMDRDTGTLYLTQPLDREAQAKYTFQAHAVADGSGNAEDPMDIIVNVIDQNDNKPVFIQDTFLGDVPEASSIGYEVIKVVATDLDQPNTDNSDIRYRILSQDPELPSDFLFVINPVSGAIRVNAGGLDREKYPKYTLVVQASDMVGEGSSGEAKVILTVTDSNDNAPAFTQTTVPVLHFPKSGEGLSRRKGDWVIPDINVAENDRGPYPLKVSQIRSNEDKIKKIYYSITGPGADEDPVNLFTMDRDTGTLYLTQPLDREAQAKYTFQAHAVADGSGNAEDPMDIIVNVIDQNDNKPVFIQDTFLGDVPEASSIGYEVIKVVATDLDQPNTDNSDIRYRILSQDPELPSDFLFVINPVSGAIRVNAGGLDREKYPKYTLVVQASDMVGEGSSGEAKVILTVTDSNDNAPAFTQTTVPVLHFPKSGEGLSRRKRDWVIPDINVAENDRGPYPLKVSQIRSNEDKIKKIYYSITGPGADKDPVNLFTMDRDTGTLYLTQPLDREAQAKYTFQAHAVADGSGNAEDPMDIIVNVIDQNDNKPVFIQDTFLGDVPEASSIGYEVIKVVATDLDQPNTDNSDIRYRILSQDPELPSDFLFVINPVSGAIRVNAGGLDREKYPKYTLVVQASDMVGEGSSGEAKVILTVTDSNDNAPAFTQTTYEATVAENKVDVQVITMSVTDGDEPHSPAWNAKFKIVDGDPGGLFTVKTGSNKHEGIISTAKGLDFEKSSKHTLLVAVENEVPFATPLPTATATVVVTVQDINEAPVFEPKEKLVSKREDLAVDAEVVQYIASDPDTARKQKVMYRIIRDPAGWLNVGKETGVIKVKSPMDRESSFVKDNKYTALIGAYDNDEVPATGTGTLVIKLEDVNDNAPTIEERSIMVCNKETAPQLLAVTDKDGSGFAAPYSVSLQGMSKTNWTARMNDSKTGIILNLATELESGQYTVILRVSDNQGLEQDSTVQATVCDCKGEAVSCLRVASVPQLPIILGILGGVLLLLMLVLLLLLFARRRRGEKKEPLLQDDDIRDNIYYYDEEGGGEDDQDYDLSVLHRGLDNRPEVFRNDVVPNFMPAPQYRPRPANPEEIGNFIDDNLKAADNDPTAPPYDSLLVFDYEGGGSDAGSLSSLNSSSSGDQDYDCLSEWGPRFKKLADMYGGGEDDML